MKACVATVNLPRLVGSRSAALNLTLGLGYVVGQPVIINCREVRWASGEFLDELVQRTLVDLGVTRLDVVGGSDELVDMLRSAAARIGLADLVVQRQAGWRESSSQVAK